MIFACGDQTFFKIDESILTGAMLPKINVVANKSTICKFTLYNFDNFYCIERYNTLQKCL